MRILVAYAGVHGSTEQIARRVAARLSRHDLEVTCLDVADVRDAAAYDGFVVGSAIHDGAWLPAASGFVHANASTIGSRPTWLFSVGMPAALARVFRKVAMREGTLVLEEFRDDVRPRGTALFSGVFRREHVPAHSAAALWLLGGHFGDFRDWAEIDAWADGVEATLALPV